MMGAVRSVPNSGCPATKWRRSWSISTALNPAKRRLSSPTSFLLVFRAAPLVFEQMLQANGSACRGLYHISTVAAESLQLATALYQSSSRECLLTVRRLLGANERTKSCRLLIAPAAEFCLSVCNQLPARTHLAYLYPKSVRRSPELAELLGRNTGTRNKGCA